MRFPDRPEDGFTLIELLVVIAIIGILSAVVLASLQDARNGAHDTAVKQHVNQLANTVEANWIDDRDYSSISFASLGGGFVAAGNTDVVYFQTAAGQQCADHNFGDARMNVVCTQIEDSFDETGTFSNGAGTWTADIYMFINTPDDNSKYVIFANLRSANEEWFCADSDGTRKVIDTPPFFITRCP